MCVWRFDGEADFYPNLQYLEHSSDDTSGSGDRFSYWTSHSSAFGWGKWKATGHELIDIKKAELSL